MKKIFCISFMVLLLTGFVQAISVEAAETPSDAVTSFFGEYEPPEETPVDKVNQTPADQKTGDVQSPINGKTQDELSYYYTETGSGAQQLNREGQRILPATGSDYMNLLQFAGVGLIVAAWIILKKEKNNEKKNVEIGGWHFTRWYDF